MSLQVYTWNTPNGYKIPILLEELGVPYSIHPVNISIGEQHLDTFVSLNINQKIPVLVDTEANVTIAESAAILMYLADKHERFLSKEVVVRTKQLEWLMFQISALGPTVGQLYHFSHVAHDKIPYAIQRFSAETERVFRVLDTRLSTDDFLGGVEYSIADIATWPWVRKAMLEELIRLSEYPHVERWFRLVEARGAVVQGLCKTDAAVGVRGQGVCPVV